MSVYYLMSQSDRNRGIQFYTFKKQTGRVDHTWVSLPAVFFVYFIIILFFTHFQSNPFSSPKEN